MNVCFITKYPPIQGGVSTQCYWAARGLAERGHVVRVVTNADEVEDVFKIDVPPEDKAVGGPYAPQFIETGGRVDVDSTEKPDRTKIYYIPLGNPTVSRLVSRGLKAVEDGRCEVIFSHYLEPYGLAASIVSSWTGIPFVFKHAGSDLFRLMEVPDLQPCYREVLCRAHRVISGGPAQKIMRSHGVSELQIASAIGFGLPKMAFHPCAPTADLGQMLAAVRDRWAGETVGLDALVAPLEPDLPLLGIYGKIGEQKGTFDLLSAARILIDQGFPFHIIVMGRGWSEARFGRQIADLGLSRYVRMHPFIPHWRIPGFIRACDAIAFLERDFAIRAHSPTIPSEVLSCGTCLIVSEEVLRKQLFRASARQHENLMIVRDPRDHNELARAIRYALEDIDRAGRIGLTGYRLTADLVDVADYVDGLERILGAVIGEPSPVRAGRDASPSDERQDPDVVVERLYHYTAALLGEDCRHVARTALAGSAIGAEAIGPREFAVAVGKRLLHDIESVGLEHVRDMCRYELMMHEWVGEQDRTAEPTSNTMRIDGCFTVSSVRISLRGDIAVEAFEYDVEEMALMITRGEPLPADVDKRFHVPEGLLVAFHRGSFPQKVSRATATLLLLLREGTTSVDEVHSRLNSMLEAKSGDLDSERLADILQGLFWEGIIDFEVDQGMVAENSLASDVRIGGAT